MHIEQLISAANCAGKQVAHNLTWETALETEPQMLHWGIKKVHSHVELEVILRKQTKQGRKIKKKGAEVIWQMNNRLFT